MNRINNCLLILVITSLIFVFSAKTASANESLLFDYIEAFEQCNSKKLKSLFEKDSTAFGLRGGLTSGHDFANSLKKQCAKGIKIEAKVASDFQPKYSQHTIIARLNLFFLVGESQRQSVPVNLTIAKLETSNKILHLHMSRLL